MLRGGSGEGETIIVARSSRKSSIARKLLIKMGARIKAMAPSNPCRGRRQLVGCEHRVIPTASNAEPSSSPRITNGELEIKHCNLDHLIAVVDRLDEVGVKIERQNGTFSSAPAAGSIRWR